MATPFSLFMLRSRELPRRQLLWVGSPEHRAGRYAELDRIPRLW